MNSELGPLALGSTPAPRRPPIPVTMHNNVTIGNNAQQSNAIISQNFKKRRKKKSKN
jgi:hypothetical protein